MKYVYLGCAYLKDYDNTIQLVVYQVFSCEKAARKWYEYRRKHLKNEDVINYFYERRPITRLQNLGWLLTEKGV